MPGYTARDHEIARDLRAEEEAERVRREARVAKQMPLAQAVAVAIVSGIEDYACEDVAETIETLSEDRDVAANVGNVCESLHYMNRDADDGATNAGLSPALLYALWRLDVLACEPESLDGDRVRWDGFGSVEAIRRAVELLGGAS